MDKLLVISHTPFSNYANNGKTLTSILDFLDKEQLAQLYFNNSTPSFDICDTYFQVSDSDVLKNIIGKTKIKSYNNVESLKEIDKVVSNHSHPIKSKLIKSNFFKILRDLWWKTYNSSELINWVKKISPNKILIVVGGDIFSIRLANKILKNLDPEVSVFLYFTDDYIINKYKDNSILLKLYRYNLKYFKELNKLMNVTKGVFVISDKMKKAYRKYFDVEISVIMNSVSPKFLEYRRKNNKTLKIAYFGGLHLQRWHSIKFLAEIFEKNKIKSEINVYTNSINKELIDLTQDYKFSSIINHEFIKNNKKLEETMDKYDFLLHIESYDEKMKDITKYSISTKISEYLSRNKPIITVGPKDVASIEYLIDNDLCIHIEDSLNKVEIVKLFSQKNIMRIVSKYNNIVTVNHSKLKQQNLVKKKMNL